MADRFGIALDKQYFNFGAAHFLIFADGTREELHGHNYHASLELEGALGGGHLVADFIVVKPLFKRCCDALDHRTLLPSRHPLLRIARADGSVTVQFRRQDGGDDQFVLPERDVCLVDIANTSSELIAQWLLDSFRARLAEALPSLAPTRIRVSVQESPGQAGWVERRFDG